MRRLATVLMLWLLTGWATGQTVNPETVDPAIVARLLEQSGRGQSLAQLLDWQRRSYPRAVVTSGFYDARSVSRYRSRPGLHLGYDIAMPAGSRVLAAWSGRVVAVTPWASGEWGVTIDHGHSTATYGHIVPAVEVGASVTPGTVVGTIAIDHLDVKMRDAQGAPLDFGEPTAPADEPRRLLLTWWLAHLQAGRPTLAASRGETCRRRLSSLPEQQRLGLLSQREADAQRRQLEAELLQLKKSERESRLWKTRLEAARRQARKAGLGWTDVIRLAQSLSLPDQAPSAERPAAESDPRRRELLRQLAELGGLTPTQMRAAGLDVAQPAGE